MQNALVDILLSPMKLKQQHYIVRRHLPLSKDKTKLHDKFYICYLFLFMPSRFVYLHYNYCDEIDTPNHAVLSVYLDCLSALLS